jgi:OmpA-OmpF porin, OOP family
MWNSISHPRPSERSTYNAYVDLPPPVVRIPRAKYIVDDDEASEEDIYEALNAPPIERLQRGYALEEVRESRWLRERMRRVDLNAINFAFASWEWQSPARICCRWQRAR